MRKRDLFYYVFENNENEYAEISNLIIEIAGFSNLTEERELLLKNLYFRVLFGIAFLEKSNYAIEEIVKDFENLFNENKLNEIRNKFSIVIDMIKEKLNQVEQNVKE